MFERTDVRYLADAMLADEAGVRDYQNFDGLAFRTAAKATAPARLNCPRSAAPRRSCWNSLIAAYGVTMGKRPPRLWVEKTPLNETGLEEAFEFWPQTKAIYVSATRATCSIPTT